MPRAVMESLWWAESPAKAQPGPRRMAEEILLEACLDAFRGGDKIGDRGAHAIGAHDESRVSRLFLTGRRLVPHTGHAVALLHQGGDLAPV